MSYKGDMIKIKNAVQQFSENMTNYFQQIFNYENSS